MTGQTERGKMLAGQLYLAGDPELEAMRARARELLRVYNMSPHGDVVRRKILGDLLGSCGQGVWIEPPFYCDYGVHLSLGEGTYVNFNCVFLDCAAITVGRNVMFGPAVQLYTAHHPVIAAERIQGPELASPITIGDNCWIGGGSIVCPGVAIGVNSTIGAGSVVVRDIPSGVLAVGNPCRVVRKLPLA